MTSKRPMLDDAARRLAAQLDDDFALVNSGMGRLLTNRSLDN